MGYIFDELQSMLIKSETIKLSESKNKDKPSAAKGQASEQTKSVQGEHHPKLPRTRLRDLIGYWQ